MDAARLQRAAVLGSALASAMVLLAAVIVAKRRFMRLAVEGLSMVPVLAPGDRVLVLRTDRVTVGDLVALVSPDGDGSVLVKRVVGVERSSIRVEGDNTAASRDSRHFGPIPLSAVIGRVLWCYWSPYHPARRRS